MPTSRALGKDIRIIVLPYPMPLAIFSSVGRVHGVARLGVTPSHPPWRCAQPQKALRAESNGIKTTGGKPKDILIWNSSVKWINIDREFQHVAHNSEMQLFESPGWLQRIPTSMRPCYRDTHRRFDTLHKWCQEWPIMSGITLTRIGLVGRCVPVPIYYFGLAKISIE